MNYKIVKKESFDVIEKAKLQNEEDANKSIPEFWSKSHRDGTVKKLLELTADPEFIFGICYGNTREDEKRFVYSIGAPIAENTPVPDGFRRNTVPARTWIVFECKGAMPNAIQELWRRIVSEFFPASGYTPTLEMDIEAYSNGDMSDPDYHSEIWLPIENK